MKAEFFESVEELEEWLVENHARVSELWIGFYKKASGRARINYKDALDAALCFGWIDGVRKSVDESRFTIRFTPRKARSIWSAVNIKRASELEKSGRMNAAGLAAFRGRDVERANRYSFEQKTCEFGAALEKQFRSDAAGWQFFQDQPPGYRRVAMWWVVSAVKDETKLKRLATLMEDSANGRRIALVARSTKKTAR